MPGHALKACQKELKRLKKMPNAMPEYALTRNYLELMAELPWSKQTKDVLDIAQARWVTKETQVLSTNQSLINRCSPRRDFTSILSDE